MKHIPTFESFINESVNESINYWGKKIDFKDWLKDMLKAWPFLAEEFKSLKVNPKKLTEDNFFDVLSKEGKVYNPNWLGMVLYKTGQYINVAKNESTGRVLFSVRRELSSFGDWDSNTGEGAILKNPNPNIDTSREGT